MEREAALALGTSGAEEDWTDNRRNGKYFEGNENERINILDCMGTRGLPSRGHAVTTNSGPSALIADGNRRRLRSRHEG